MAGGRYVFATSVFLLSKYIYKIPYRGAAGGVGPPGRGSVSEALKSQAS